MEMSSTEEDPAAASSSSSSGEVEILSAAEAAAYRRAAATLPPQSDMSKVLRLLLEDTGGWEIWDSVWHGQNMPRELPVPFFGYMPNSAKPVANFLTKRELFQRLDYPNQKRLIVAFMRQSAATGKPYACVIDRGARSVLVVLGDGEPSKVHLAGRDKLVKQLRAWFRANSPNRDQEWRVEAAPHFCDTQNLHSAAVWPVIFVLQMVYSGGDLSLATSALLQMSCGDLQAYVHNVQEAYRVIAGGTQ